MWLPGGSPESASPCAEDGSDPTHFFRQHTTLFPLPSCWLTPPLLAPNERHGAITTASRLLDSACAAFALKAGDLNLGLYHRFSRARLIHME
jgi:hypothetical protein